MTRPASDPAGIALPRRSWVRQIMGMPISVLCRGPAARDDEADAVVAAVFDDLRGVDEEFSPYLPDSAVARIRAGLGAIGEGSERVREVAERAEHWRDRTGGRFDARRPDGTWDPSGLVKGWAVERAAVRFERLADLDWCLNAGGDVLLSCVTDRTFVVGIADPRDPARVLASVALGAGAVATSGTGARGQHIYDPALRGTSAPIWASVSVTGPSLETADVLATAAFVAGREWKDLLAQFPGYAGLAISASGRREVGPGWPG